MYVHESFTKQHKYTKQALVAWNKIHSCLWVSIYTVSFFFVSLLVHPQSNVVDGVFLKVLSRLPDWNSMYFHSLLLLNIFGIFLVRSSVERRTFHIYPCGRKVFLWVFSVSFTLAVVIVTPTSLHLHNCKILRLADVLVHGWLNGLDEKQLKAYTKLCWKCSSVACYGPVSSNVLHDTATITSICHFIFIWILKIIRKVLKDKKIYLF